MNALRAVVDRLEGARHVPGDRAGDQHLALAALDHPLHDRLDQQQGAGDVGVDDVLPLVRALVEEAVTEAVAGIGDEHVDRSLADAIEQLVDALLRREVDFDLLDLDAELLQRRPRLDERRVGGDDQVVAVLAPRAWRARARFRSRRR